MAPDIESISPGIDGSSSRFWWEPSPNGPMRHSSVGRDVELPFRRALDDQRQSQAEPRYLRGQNEVRLAGNDVLIGAGVTLYFACDNYPNLCSAKLSSDRDGARIRATGNGAVLLTAPTSGTYRGLTIFADRDNTNTFTFRGNGTNENGSAEASSGTIYIKSGTLDLRSNGYTLASQSPRRRRSSPKAKPKRCRTTPPGFASHCRVRTRVTPKYLEWAGA